MSFPIFKRTFVFITMAISLPAFSENKCVEALKPTSQSETSAKSFTLTNFLKGLLKKEQTSTDPIEQREQRFREEERRRLEERERELKMVQKLRSEVPALFDSNPFFASAFGERLSAIWFHAVVLPKNPVFLAFGNSETPLSKVQEEGLRETVAELLRKKKTILFDGDATSGDLIRELAPEALGISSSNQNDLKFSNSFLKMENILAAGEIIFTPDSLLGIGLLIEGQQQGVPARFRVFDSENQWTQGLTNWPAKSFKNKIENLGIKYSSINEVKVSTSIDQLKEVIASSHDEGKSEIGPRPSFKEILSRVNDRAFLEIHEEAMNEVTSFQALQKEDSRSLGGAVVFGSGKGSADFQDLVYFGTRRVARLGAAIRHGGAGGFMQVAGDAALKEKSLSLGIPLIGKFSLKGESKISSDSQSFTIRTSSYSVRIPTLLKDVPLVVIAPGGMGTMKELASTLISEASKKEHRWIIFMGESYYGPLHDFINSLPLPVSMKEKIKMVSNDQEMDQVLTEIKTKDPKAYQQLVGK